MWFLLALISGSCTAVLAILLKAYLKHINPLLVTLLFSAVTTIILLLTDLFTRQVQCKLAFTLDASAWWAIIIIGCVNAIGYSCYLAALKCGNTAGVVALDRLSILLVVLLSVLFLHEPWSLKTLIGAVVMIVGAVLITL
ncbi:MAG TPA: EamA family transporter [Candidatus Babeliales bacterium]|nr:EamA family transporter [Candidatus Babeliales bacterium]